MNYDTQDGNQYPLQFRTIILLALLIFGTSLGAQDSSSIRGQVLDKETNDPLIGVSISIKGTILGTSTDDNGNFELKTDLKLPVTLMANFLGYDEKEIIVQDNIENVSIILSG